MPEIQLSIFNVIITPSVVSQGVVQRTSAASVVAGPNNVTLGLTLKDEFGNFVSGYYTITVKGGDWFNGIVEFTDGIAIITFSVNIAGVYVDIPVAVVVV